MATIMEEDQENTSREHGLGRKQNTAAKVAAACTEEAGPAIRTRQDMWIHQEPRSSRAEDSTCVLERCTVQLRRMQEPTGGYRRLIISAGGCVFRLCLVQLCDVEEEITLMDDIELTIARSCGDEELAIRITLLACF